jgi:hypothetical protein
MVGDCNHTEALGQGRRHDSLGRHARITHIMRTAIRVDVHVRPVEPGASRQGLDLSKLRQCLPSCLIEQFATRSDSYSIGVERHAAATIG